MTDEIEPIKVQVHAISISDALGYRAQQAVAQAVAGGGDYRIIGGHMVRMLLHVYPTANAVLRSTADADAALESVEVVEPVTQNLVAENFIKDGWEHLVQGCWCRADRDQSAARQDRRRPGDPNPVGPRGRSG